MADSRDDLAESLQNLFTSVSSMVKSELQERTIIWIYWRR
ncbi:unnamed protein product [Arabidopsis halleri]